MGKRLQNLSLETRVLRVVRPNQTIEYVVNPSRFKNLTSEEYSLLVPPPPLDPLVWLVEDTGSEPAPPPPPLPATTSTDDLPEGLINKYFTEARARQAAVADTIVDGVTNVAPSQNIVFDTLTSKVETASNVGTGTGNLFKQKTGTNLELRRLKQSTNVTIIQNGDDIEISAASTGEVNTGSNRGTAGVGKAEVFFQKAGADLEFKRLLAGTSITLSQDNDSITINSAAGSGEANTASNRGTAGAGKAEVFFQKTGVDLEFKRIVEGTGVTVTQDNDAVTIAASSQVQDSISDGETALAPSQNAVFDALAGKSDVGHTHVAADITDFNSAAVAAVGTQVQDALVTILPASVATLDATPVTIIPAPGVGLAIVIESVELFLDFVSSSYSGTGDLLIEYSASAPILGFSTTGFLNSASDAHRIKVGHTEFDVMLVNNLVQIRAANPVTNPGDSPLKVRARYRTITALS